ncbi:MAG: hypothetical protein ABGZ35_30345 [Planctomycetaceae bacterium]
MTHTLSARTTTRRKTAGQMSPEVCDLNRRYLSTVKQRSLSDAATVDGWRDRPVNVFLRHESDHVFAIAGDDLIGMADFVAIEAATFHVDEAGRQQACRGAGDLPNGRNVHAFVRGRLLWATMHSQLRTTADWQRVVYNPHRMSTFRLLSSGLAMHRAELVVFTPHPTCVWCVPRDECGLAGAVE